MNGNLTHESDAEKLFKMIPTDGSNIGNTTLRNNLGWDSEKYLAVRRTLIDKGSISTGRGKGGSVHRLGGPGNANPLPETSNNIESNVSCQEKFPDEKSLYDPMIKVINDFWVPDINATNHLIVNTSSGGRRKDGTWARPDITVIAKSSYPFIPTSYLNVYTFEVKHFSGLSLTAVYEALAHRRRSTHAIVLVYMPDSKVSAFKDQLSEIQEEAGRHGIGLIVASDVTNFDTWDIRETQERIEPDPAKLSEFITSQLTESDRGKISSWFS